jgi:hypothetical protein
MDFVLSGAASALNSVDTFGDAEEEALAEMQRCDGTQFDPQVVAALARVSGAA